MTLLTIAELTTPYPGWGGRQRCDRPAAPLSCDQHTRPCQGSSDVSLQMLKNPQIGKFQT